MWRKWDRQLQSGQVDEYKGACRAGAAWKHVLARSAKLGISITDRMKLRQLGERAEPADDRDRFFEVVG